MFKRGKQAEFLSALATEGGKCPGAVVSVSIQALVPGQI